MPVFGSIVIVARPGHEGVGRGVGVARAGQLERERRADEGVLRMRAAGDVKAGVAGPLDRRSGAGHRW